MNLEERRKKYLQDHPEYAKDLESDLQRIRSGAPRLCTVEGCSGKHVARGYCLRHYTRVIRFKRPLEQPTDNNPNAHEDLTEAEFCILKDLRSQGMTPKDLQHELRKGSGVILEAWEYETFGRYLKRTREGKDELHVYDIHTEDE